MRQVVSVVRTLKYLASWGDCGYVDARFGMTETSPTSSWAAAAAAASAAARAPETASR